METTEEENIKNAYEKGRQEAQKEFEEKIKEIKVKYRKKWETTSLSKVWWENMLDELLTSISGAENEGSVS